MVSSKPEAVTGDGEPASPTSAGSPTDEILTIPPEVANFAASVDTWLRSGDEGSFYAHVALVPYTCGVTNANDVNTGPAPAICEGVQPGETRFGIMRTVDTNVAVLPPPDASVLKGPHEGVELPGEERLTDKFGAGGWRIVSGCWRSRFCS